MPYPWSAGNVLTATDLNSSLAAKTDLAMTQNAQTGSSYSYTLLDASKLLTMNNAASNTVTVTKQATVTWVTGTQLRIMNLGAGTTTLVADTGVTINNNKALAQYQGGTLIRTASDVWLFVPTASSSGLTLISEQSFTAVSAVNFTSLLTSAYRNYRLMFYSNNSGSMRIRLRSASTDDSSSNYDLTGSLGTDAAGTSWRGLDSANCTINTIIFDLLGPAVTNVTGVSIMAYQSTPGTNQFSNVANGQHRAATAFDGVSIILGGAGAFTGTAKLYGYQGA